jgi:spermidine synthase
MSHPNIKDSWFTESQTMWPGQAMTLQVKKQIHHERSSFQDILIFDSTNHGRVLVLDGVIQCTEMDEFAYQEMIAHLPLFSHQEPKKVWKMSLMIALLPPQAESTLSIMLKA